MAETVLVKADLTSDMIAAGRGLLTGLDAHGMIFDAAFWLLDEESGNWHLVLSSRSVRKDGSLALYHKVNRVLTKLRLQGAIWIGVISIVDHRAQIVQSLREALGTAGSVDGVRLDNATIDGVRVPACLVYRLSAKQKLAAQAGKPITVGRRLA
jgi:hypothetical protein